MVTKRIKASRGLREMNEAELVNLDRLAHILSSLSESELETLEILLDRSAARTVKASLRELDGGEGIPIDEW